MIVSKPKSLIHKMKISSRKSRFSIFIISFNLLFIAIIFWGFSKTFFLRNDYSDQDLPLLHSIHGISWSAWFLVFLLQVFLIITRKTSLHKKIGWTGLFIASVVTLFSFIVIFNDNEAQQSKGFLLMQLLTGSMYMGFVIGGILWRKKPVYHSRLMILACIPPLLPALSRIDLGVGMASPITLFGIINIILIIILFVDRLISGRFNKALNIGVIGLLIYQGLSILGFIYLG